MKRRLHRLTFSVLIIVALCFTTWRWLNVNRPLFYNDFVFIGDRGFFFWRPSPPIVDQKGNFTFVDYQRHLVVSVKMEGGSAIEEMDLQGDTKNIHLLNMYTGEVITRIRTDYNAIVYIEVNKYHGQIKATTKSYSLDSVDEAELLDLIGEARTRLILQ